MRVVIAEDLALLRELGHVDIVDLGSPGAAIPQHDGAAAVLTLGNDSFPLKILHRVIFHPHGQPFLGPNVRRSFRHGP